MRRGRYSVRLEKRVAPGRFQAAIIWLLATLTALVLFGVIFVLAGVNPLLAYREIFRMGFANRFGLPLTISRLIFLLLCTYAFILPFRAGLWNIGMAGQLYMGALGAYAVLFAFGGKEPDVQLSPAVVIPLMMVGAALCGAAFGGVAGLLKGWLNVNEIVVTMMLNSVAHWFVSHMIKEGGPFMNIGGRGEGFDLPESVQAPLILGIPFTVFVALAIGVLLYFLFAKTRLGYQIKAYGQSQAAARYAGISALKTPLLVFIIGGAVAGLAGYHHFAAVPNVFKISRDYGVMGEMAFYGIICGLVSQGSALASVPVALLFAGLSNGARFVQGKLHMKYGVDHALLGVLVIVLVAFQFFHRYRVVWTRERKESLDVGIHH